jgi:hypothetical protein
MDPAKVPVDERVPALGLLGRFVVEAEVPCGVFSSGVSFKERVLINRLGLNFGPVAVEHILASVDGTASMRDSALRPSTTP